MWLTISRTVLTLGTCLFAACSTPTQTAQTKDFTASNTNSAAHPQKDEQLIEQSSTNQNSGRLVVQNATVNSFDTQKTTPLKSKNSPLFVPFRRDYVQKDGQLSPYLEQWALHLSQQRQIPYPHIEALLKQVSYEPQVIKLMTPAKGKRGKRSWSAYQERFTDKTRIDDGLSFWRRHQDIIEQTAQKYQIPASVLVAIIGVETIYGSYMGDFSVLNALTNLGFGYPDPERPERATMFRNQLADLIELHYQGKLDANTARGSFAGAMGLPQFMPTSIKQWAIDADGKGHIDLFHSVPDALASVANFLNHHGWQAPLPVFIDVEIPANSQIANKVDGGLSPTLDWQELQAPLGLPEQPSVYAQQKLGLVDLPDQVHNTVEYRLASANFFALTEYNRSYFYASAVADLACALERRHYQRQNCSLWASPDSQ
ncbi:MAG TPA: lytic murein transglycosylase B [Paenalcaligenes sp.]|nr:lytic murein transglycosylase B [Paenalcaligenes sp.]